MPVAAVDIGTNSARLLIADDSGRELERVMTITRLGAGVDRHGALANDAIERTVAVLADYGARIRTHGARAVRAVATSAARDAENRARFFDDAERALGARPELLSAEDEALLSFRGATADLAPDEGPFLVFDIGGGSTEFVLGDEAPAAWASVPLGCVRMTERHLASDPPTDAELAACAADARGQLGTVQQMLNGRRARRVIGLAGTVTSLAAYVLGLARHDPSRTHHSVLSKARVEDAFERLRSLPERARREVLTEPARASEILGGTAVLRAILETLNIQELLVSEKDILDGIAAELRAKTQPNRSAQPETTR